MFYNPDNITRFDVVNTVNLGKRKASELLYEYIVKQEKSINDSYLFNDAENLINLTDSIKNIYPTDDYLFAEPSFIEFYLGNEQIKQFYGISINNNKYDDVFLHPSKAYRVNKASEYLSKRINEMYVNYGFYAVPFNNSIFIYGNKYDLHNNVPIEIYSKDIKEQVVVHSGILAYGQTGNLVYENPITNAELSIIMDSILTYL